MPSRIDLCEGVLDSFLKELYSKPSLKEKIILLGFTYIETLMIPTEEAIRVLNWILFFLWKEQNISVQDVAFPTWFLYCSPENNPVIWYGTSQPLRSILNLLDGEEFVRLLFKLYGEKSQVSMDRLSLSLTAGHIQQHLDDHFYTVKNFCHFYNKILCLNQYASSSRFYSAHGTLRKYLLQHS